MKVVHLEAGRHLWGGAQQVLYLVAGLQAEGWDNLLVCPPGSEIGAAARHRGLSVRELTLRSDLDIPFIWRFRRLIRHEQPDLVHLHSRRGADTLGALAARLSRTPMVLTRRVDNPEPRWAAAVKYALADQVVAISAGVREALEAAGVPGAKISCIPSTVDVERFDVSCDRGWFEQALGVAPGDKTIGMFAHFIERKGHRYMLRALPRVLEAHGSARLILCGKGRLEPTVRGWVKELGLEARVIFAGFRTDVERVMSCVDVVAHPATMEGMGVVLLQAAAARRAVVASAVGGIPEVIVDEETGLLVPPGDPQALAAALSRVLGDRGLARRLGQSAFARVSRSFSIPTMVAGYQDLYRNVLGAGAPASPHIS